MKAFFRLLSEGISFAASSLYSNRLRTILSLLGITIGIFAIISVFTLVDSMENSIRSGIESLGDDVIFIEQMPWAPEKGDKEYAWWKYFQRPKPTIREADELRSRSNSAASVCLITGASRTITHFSSTIENTSIWAVSQGYDLVMQPKFSKGRFFTENEMKVGRNLCVIGADIESELFPGSSGMGKEIKIQGYKAEIIGVLEKEGESLIGNSSDEVVIVPVLFGRNFIELEETSTQIAIKAKEGIQVKELRDEITGVMRAVRRLRPGEDNNFAINESSMLNSGLDQLFGMINLAGLIIGGFSILVGGFSIANIMFVSVRERTSIIGIQKALGAKRSFILFQFLAEAIILAVIGGAIGLFIIFLGTFLAGLALDMSITLSGKNILIGLGFSAGIGLVSGLFPAFIASRLEPVEAIRSNG